MDNWCLKCGNGCKDSKTCFKCNLSNVVTIKELQYSYLITKIYIFSCLLALIGIYSESQSIVASIVTGVILILFDMFVVWPIERAKQLKFTEELYGKILKRNDGNISHELIFPCFIQEIVESDVNYFVRKHKSDQEKRRQKLWQNLYGNAQNAKCQECNKTQIFPDSCYYIHKLPNIRTDDNIFLICKNCC